MSCADRARVRVRLRVSGLVQGVFYRQSTAVEAARLGLAGSVRNLPDGSVEVVAEGRRAGVETLVAWCRRGPPAARVEEVEAGWEAAHRGRGPVHGPSLTAAPPANPRIHGGSLPRRSTAC